MVDVSISLTLASSGVIRKEAQECVIEVPSSQQRFSGETPEAKGGGVWPSATG